MSRWRPLGAVLGLLLCATQAWAAGSLTVAANPAYSRFTYKITTPYSSFSSAGTTFDLTIYALPAKTRLVSVLADSTVAWTGTACTAITAQLGKSAGGVEYLIAFDAKTATIRRGLADADLGTSINRATAVQGGDLPSFTAETNLSVRVTTTLCNTNALTAGSIDWYLTTEALP